LAAGPLLALRLALLHAKPWQQLVVCAVIVGVGITLVTFGDLTGIIVICLGVFFAVPALSKMLPRAWRFLRRLVATRDEES
jgi:hypothetical protein